MKKLVYLTFLLFATSIAVNAQFFVGGGFSFNMTGGSITTNGVSVDKDKVTTISFTPKAGIFLSDDFAAGAQLILSSSRTKTPATGTIDKSSSFGIAPFARYYALRLDKFSVFGQAELGLVFGSQKTEVNGNTTNGPKSTNFGFSIYPGIAYDASDKIQLEAYISGFNFGFSSNTVKQSGIPEIKNVTTKFGFGVDLDQLATSGAINIGMIIKL